MIPNANKHLPKHKPSFSIPIIQSVCQHVYVPITNSLNTRQCAANPISSASILGNYSTF